MRPNCVSSSVAQLSTLALCAFWGCRRLGELTLDTVKSFNAAHDSGREVISIHLPWTKSTGVRGGTLVITATDDDLCPVRALDNHFRVNALPDHNTPLYAYRSDAGWKPLVKTDFLVFIAGFFRDGGLEQVFGHSFLMKIGGWSSTCFLIYWRRLEIVIPVALIRAWSTKQSAFASRHSLPDDFTSEIDVVHSQ
ncbi:hypothetical protein GGX14DRAFT_557595 [Mycena pura]|uniref:Uncharacterized protein n=1 Tax=Mycena pura TaxID=153505 RepID=A0AAD6YLL7_9AGAR|nr:hypothetical protein GGX14DRAFT_557595 [Mycena pura]